MLSRISSNLINKNLFIRSLRTLEYGPGIPKEIVYSKKYYEDDKIQSVLGREKIAVLGYGPQGRAQALNLRDNGLDVFIGVRLNGNSAKDAKEDGFTVYDIDEASSRGTFIMNLLSDSGQMDTFKTVSNNLVEGDTLYFSHGFGVTYKDQTKMNVDSLDNDVILVAPKGCGSSVRDYFVNKNGGINSSYAVYNDITGMAKEKALAVGFGIGSPYIYETTFENEANSDLTGERSVLMGGIAGLFSANYRVLRENGHSPSEAFNETVEEALMSLFPKINEKGMDYMFANCSTTAQRGAIDWSKRFEEVNYKLINELYDSVKSGEEARIVIEANSDPNYRENLEKELDEIASQEIWQVGRKVRELRK